ncbi:MAG: hypothetical protein R2815_10090 [Flavobacteriales bacterium]
MLRSQGLAATHRAVVQAGLSGPAFSLALGRGTIGAGIRLRGCTSAPPGSLRNSSNFIYHGLNYVPQRGDVAGMPAFVPSVPWTEFGLSYAHILHAQGGSAW